jgi:hypothetical protein
MAGLEYGQRLVAASRAPQWAEQRLGGVVRGTAPRWRLPLYGCGGRRDFACPQLLQPGWSAVAALAAPGVFADMAHRWGVGTMTV